MKGQNPLYAQLILPLATGRTFTYIVPEVLTQEIAIGKRVTVQFGRGAKIYSAVVFSFADEATAGIKAKPILSVLDKQPLVDSNQLRFWVKMADHYLCSLGEIMIAALPAQLLLDSETRITSLPASDARQNLPHKEQVALGILDQRHVLSLEEIGELLGLKNPMSKVKKWVEDEFVSIEEKLVNRFVPKATEIVQLTEPFNSETGLNYAFELLAKAPKQTHVLMSFIQLANPLETENAYAEKKRLLRNSEATSSVLKELIKKEILVVRKRTDIPAAAQSDFQLPQLSEAQNNAYKSIVQSFSSKSVCLLHGITSSGKTELYLKLIQEQVKANKQVLYLLPEIALTTQMITRIATRMGEGVRIFHSRLTQRERARMYADMVTHPESVDLVLSARSGIFLPFKNLGAIIVDEEHDPSFKQQAPAPRYQARDMAIVLSLIHGAKTLLGSATPAVETLFNAKQGKYGYARLLERFGKVQLPKIETANIQEAKKKQQMHGRFAPELITAINDRLLLKEQVILFQNRRGYTPVWQCTDCGWVPECDHCDVSLTFHKTDNGLRCHYCGRFYETVSNCKACNSLKLKMIGFGTEMLEEELAGLFPNAKVARLDQDTTRRKNAYAQIMQDLADGEIDILVGTQMVTKGLDLERVTLVGIMNADALIKFPEFRAAERAFQLMSQVAGRAGRREKIGVVIIQTYDPHQQVIEMVKAHDVERMYDTELAERQQFLYPPFSRLIKLTLKHRNESLVSKCARALFSELSHLLGERAIGPEVPYISRIKDQHIRNILLKLNRKTYHSEKTQLMHSVSTLMAQEEYRRIRLIIDVDSN